MTTSLTQYIVAALKDGGVLSSTEIAGAVSKASGREVEASDIGGRLKNISDSGRCDLGRFVTRERKDGVYVYRLMDAARALSEDQLYGLTLKRGDARYPLEDALSDYPELKAHVGGETGADEGETAPSGAGAGDDAEAAEKTGDAAETSIDGDVFVAGIGSSAGGLEAIYEFLEALEPGGGLAYVFISHRSKEGDGDRFLDLIRKRSALETLLAEDGMRVRPDRVYLAPRAGILGVEDGAFTVRPSDGTTEEMRPIDAFFKSLALNLGERAAGVVLSGMGSDGSAGLREIKEALGLCLAQDPDSARYDSMPRNALRHVSPDDVLAPGDMPAKLANYVRHAAGHSLVHPEKSDIPDMLPTIFSLVQSRTGRDFSEYKHSTCTRRVARRMAVHDIDNPRRYFHLLQRSPDEVAALVRELLILVTRFFRDPKAFEALKFRLREMLEDRPEDGGPVRCWVTGCSTGEEAYSIAILLKECMEDIDRRFDVQIFASDLSEEAIEAARDPRYPWGILEDVGKERLKRFFEEEEEGYRVKKEIREMLVFAVHDVIKDPPFTRLDLLSCRNMLIYMNAELQKKLLPVFHYALKENGLLFMGGSETVGSFTDLFDAVVSKMRIYRRKPGSHAREGFLQIGRGQGRKGYGDPEEKGEEDVAALHRQALLRHVAPTSLVIDKDGDILSVYGKTSRFLELPGGAATANNLFKMAKNGLKPKMPAAIRKAASDSEKVDFDYVRLRVNGDEHRVAGEVIPLDREDRMEGLLLVTLTDKGAREETQTDSDAEGKKHGGRETEKELRDARQNLQTTVEELETSNEELKSTNEELQSTNEELQSSNEELESSKEEQQSLNEELATVNSERQAKIDELSEVNKHMRNLLDNLQIPVLFLDNDLKIQRFTSKLKELIKVIPSDIGRPLSDISTRLDGKGVDLTDIASDVLSTLAYREEEVMIQGERWYQLRVLPYRTEKNVIEGVVMIFLDIQEKKEAMKASEAARRYAEAIVDTIREPLLVLNGKLKVETANYAFYDTFRLRSEDVEGRRLFDLNEGAWDAPDLRKLLEESIRDRHFFSDFSLKQDFPGLGPRRFLLNTRRLAGQSEEEEKILLAMEEKKT